ncbi:MAG: NTP transferase domain-containing protein [Bacteroidales bacterium]|nr:NTP transferase domain-containing protein [Bacteroidales bacterium]
MEKFGNSKVAAMIFAAGLGMRLYPLTKDKPKALVEINGQPLLQTVIERIIAAGITDIVVNVHHFSQLVKDYLASHSFEADIRISDETDFLLDTGGGLKFAEQLLNLADHILLHNVDILSDIDLNRLIINHIENEALATLAVKERPTSRYLIFDKKTMQLCGWENVKTGETLESRCTDNPVKLAFSGIHVVSKAIFPMIPAGKKISMTPLYVEMAKTQNVRGYLHQQDQWMDVGKYEDVMKLARMS